MSPNDADFKTVKDWKKIWKSPMVHLIANWLPEGLALFDTEAWSTPEVHPSAAADVLAGKLFPYTLTHGRFL